MLVCDCCGLCCEPAKPGTPVDPNAVMAVKPYEIRDLSLPNLIYAHCDLCAPCTTALQNAVKTAVATWKGECDKQAAVKKLAHAEELVANKPKVAAAPKDPAYEAWLLEQKSKQPAAV